MKRSRSLVAAAALLVLAVSAGAAETSPRLADLRGIARADFNHDSSRIIVQLRAGAVQLWDAAQGTPVAGDLLPDKTAATYVMSADARQVLIGFSDGARVFDTTSGAAVSPLLDARLSDQLQTPALFSPDGETVLILGEAELCVWKMRSGEAVAKIALPVGEFEEVSPAAQFTRDGSNCFVMDRAGTVTRYEAASWKAAGKPMRHAAAELAYQFGFAASPDGRWLATFDSPGENGPKAHLQLWDAMANKRLGKPIVAVNGLSAQFRGTTGNVLITPARGDAHVRELPSTKVLFKTRPHEEVDGPSAAFAPNEQWLLTWGHDRRIDLYDAATGKLLQNYLGAAAITKLMLAQDSTACYLVLDNTAFASQRLYDCYLTKLSLPELEVSSVARITEYLHSVSLAPDGTRLLVLQGNTDQERLAIYDTATMREVEWPPQ